MAHKKTKYAKKHKDRLFRFIFNQKSELLSLYNAVNDSDYTDENDLTIYTIENFIYMGMKNDLSFLIDCHLNIYEHQSTYNPNMPLRGFLYMASALKKYIAAKNLDIYASSSVTIPVPQFYVFYNGTRNVPDEQLFVQGGGDGLQGQLIVEVDIHHHWERTGLLDLGHRPGGGPIRDRHPHDLTSSRSQGTDLGQGGLHIVGAGIGHGLDGDRRPAADGDAAHMDLSGQ